VLVVAVAVRIRRGHCYMKFYLAGKVSKNCWRHTLVRDLRDAMALDGGCEESTRLPRRFPVMTDAVDGGHDYVGPCFVGCDHGQAARVPSQSRSAGGAGRCGDEEAGAATHW
jgi:hypothetical protein